MSIEIASIIIQALIGIAAFVVFLQISDSRRVFKIISKRESVKYSSELIKDFIEKIIPILNISDEDLNDIGYIHYVGNLNIKYFSAKEIFTNRSMVKHLSYTSKIIDVAEGKSKVFKSLLDSLNKLEAFSIPFIESVADESVAFDAIGSTFCSNVENTWFMYVFVRPNHISKYTHFSNTIALYNLWSSRLKKIKLEETILQTEFELEKMLARYNN